MSESLPISPEERQDDPTLRERIARARRAREAAEERVASRYAEIAPDERRWRVRDDLELPSEPLHVR